MQAKPIALVRFRFRKIELHGARKVSGVRFGNMARSEPRDGYKHNSCAEKNAAAAPVARRCGGNSPGPERVEAGNDKREAVNSRDGRQLHKREIRRRWVAQQIPRKTNFRKMCPDKLNRDPQERRGDAGSRDAAARGEIHAQRKEPRENAPGHGNQQEDANAAKVRETAVDFEDDGDPVERSEHEDEAVQKSRGESDAGARTEERKEQQHHKNPGTDGKADARVALCKKKSGKGGQAEAPNRGEFFAGRGI